MAERSRILLDEVVGWLLLGEVAVQFQTHRDLLGVERPDLQRRIAREGDAGAILAFACHFGAAAPKLESIVDFVLSQRLADGGFNCRANRSGATMSSVHSTTSVIDGLANYLSAGHTYRAADVREAIGSAAASLMERRLFQCRSNREPIRAEFTRLHHPARWHFDVLRGLDVLRGAGMAFDDRLQDAVGVLLRRRRADGRWSAAAQYPGRVHCAYPRPGEPNRWVTLRALRVLAWAT